MLPNNCLASKYVLCQQNFPPWLKKVTSQIGDPLTVIAREEEEEERSAVLASPACYAVAASLSVRQWRGDEKRRNAIRTHEQAG